MADRSATLSWPTSAPKTPRTDSSIKPKNFAQTQIDDAVPSDFVVPSPRGDLHLTEDHREVWSRGLADCICGIAAVDLEMFDLPSDPGYVVPWPKRLFTPAPDARIYVAGEKPLPGDAFRVFSPPCPSCGRYRSTTFWTQNFNATDDLIIGAAGVDTGDYPRLVRLMTWMVSAELAALIKRGGFKHVRLIKP